MYFITMDCHLRNENKGADQLHLCFRYIESTIPLLPKSEISSLLPSSVDYVGLGKKPKDSFFHNMAHIMRQSCRLYDQLF